jgi:hypothetical protein
MTTVSEVHQSRLGFHPVDFATSKKLRFINKVYYLALNRAASWVRWERKQPHNRVFKHKINGQIELLPWSEPNVCSLFHNTSPSVDKGFYKQMGYYSDNCLGPNILAASRIARTPCAKPEDVKPLVFSQAEIDNYYELAKEWYDSEKS